ncbi:MAG: hypothetical protein KF850_13170 [Labilithrix sp.]|nr:hypothetical protein [Labilithrix sp.]
MSSSRVASLAAFALACATASCAALLGFERLSGDETDGGVAEAGEDAPGVDAGGREGGACTELGVPAPPANAEPGDVPPVLGALRLLDFGLEVGGVRPEVPGLNLDLTCSVDIASSSCTTKLLPTTFETHAKDKSPTGIDNAGFSLIEYLSRLSDVLSAKSFNDGLQAGLYGAVLRVQGWNGLPDDDSVQVEVFPAIGFERNGDGGTKPAFDEHDEWKLDSRFQLGGVLEASTIKSDRAWVNGGRAVARFKEVTLLLMLSDDPKPFEVRMTDAVLSATIGTDASGKRALRDGVVAGRWKTSDFLGQVRTIYLADSNGLVDTTLCDKVPGATLIYNGVKTTVCDGRDIRSDSEDNKGLPCDAVSAAARVEAYAIDNLGTFEASVDGGGRCEDPAVPLGDDCPP